MVQTITALDHAHDHPMDYTSQFFLKLTKAPLQLRIFLKLQFRIVSR